LRAVRATGVTLILVALAGEARGADGGADGGAGAPPAAHATGVVCLRKLPTSGSFATEGKGSSMPEHYDDTKEARQSRAAGDKRMAVRIDEGAAVIVDQKKGACIDGLALDVKHVMRTPGSAAHFSFERGQTVLQLRYEPFYGHVQIETPPWLARQAAGMTTCDACALTPGGGKKRAPAGEGTRAGGRATGVVCVRKLPPPIAFADERNGGSGPLDQNTPKEAARQVAGQPRLEVSIDRGATVTVDQKGGACIDGLALDGKHVVRANRPGVRELWGRFSFEQGQPVAELRYDPFYGTFHVDTPPWMAAKTAGMSSCDACALAPTPRKKRDVGGLAGHPPAPRAERARGDRWPKPATLTGTEPLMLELPRMEGVTILDHGQRRVHPDLWSIQAYVHNARAAEALRKRGIKVELGEDPTEEELKKDISPNAGKPYEHSIF